MNNDINPIEEDFNAALSRYKAGQDLIPIAQDFQKTQKKDVIKFSAGGLRDFSRIAASNEIMWRDIFFNNKKNVVSAINLFIKNLKSFKKNIENLDDNHENWSYEILDETNRVAKIIKESLNI